MNTSFTNVPSVLKTWMRSFARSQTYSRPSFARAAQCTGVAELLGRRIVRIVGRQLRVVRLVAVGAPVPLVLAGIGVEHDHAVVAVAIGDVQFVGLRIDERLGRQPQILDVVAALALDPACRSASGTCPPCVNFRTMLSCTAPAPPIWLSSRRQRGGLSAAAVAADPDVAFVIDVMPWFEPASRSPRPGRPSARSGCPPHRTRAPAARRRSIPRPAASMVSVLFLRFERALRDE